MITHNMGPNMIQTVLKITGVDVVLRGLYSVGRYLVNAVVKVLETVLNLNWKEIFEWYEINLFGILMSKVG